MTKIFIRTGIEFTHRDEVLTHIGTEMVNQGVVHDSYPQALREREAIYPTGIMLENYAIAIPHCEAIHAKTPALYLIRPDKPVMFAQADEENDIAVSLIIALIVENPAEQLRLLRRLFSALQKTEVIETLITIAEEKLEDYFRAQCLLAEE